MKRDQTVYTCDGCRTTQAGEINTAPPGWHLVTTGELKALPPVGQGPQYHVCTTCFAGIDWIVRFQGLIVPPKVIADPKPMANHRNAPCAVEPILDPTLTCPAESEHPKMEHCGQCGYGRRPAGNTLRDVIGPISVENLPAEGWWVEPMRRSIAGNGHPHIEGTLRGNWPRLGRHQHRPGEDGPESITVVDLVETADGFLHRLGDGPKA